MLRLAVILSRSFMSLTITFVEQNTSPDDVNVHAISSWQLDSDVEDVPPSPVSRSIELLEDSVVKS